LLDRFTDLQKTARDFPVTPKQKNIVCAPKELAYNSRSNLQQTSFSSYGCGPLHLLLTAPFVTEICV
jgi:hypothetical protein